MWNYTYSFSFDVFLINSNAVVESILDYYHIPFIFFPFSISQELKKKSYSDYYAYFVSFRLYFGEFVVRLLYW